MSSVGPSLQAGDIVWVEFDPAFGHEQNGRRPALVVSSGDYNALSSFVLLCPITRRSRGWPFQTPLGAGGGQIRGEVIVDQIKSVDKRRIVSTPMARVSNETLSAIRDILAAVLGTELSE